MTLMSASDTVLQFYGGLTLFLTHNCLWANGPPTESSSFPVRLNATSFHFILFFAAHCASPLWFFPHWAQLGQKVFFWQTNFPFTRVCPTQGNLRYTSQIHFHHVAQLSDSSAFRCTWSVTLCTYDRIDANSLWKVNFSHLIFPAYVCLNV